MKQLVILVIISLVAFYALHKSQLSKAGGAVNGGGGSNGGRSQPATPEIKKPSENVPGNNSGSQPPGGGSQPITPEIRPVTQPGGGLKASIDPVGSIGGFHSGIITPEINRRIKSRTGLRIHRM